VERPTIMCSVSVAMLSLIVICAGTGTTEASCVAVLCALAAERPANRIAAVLHVIRRGLFIALISLH
jgi:hypothetical protein